MTHFACHAEAHENSSESCLVLSSDLRITLRDMRINRWVLPDAPLVVLNACGTGVRDPLKTGDFVRQLMKCGGRGVLATECDVPDLFASAFVQRVYDRFLASEPLAAALLATRREFLLTRRNPLGLLYAAYFPLETRCVPRADGMEPRPSSS